MRKWILFITLGVIFVAILTSAKDKDQKPFGIDVSHHNGKIAWQKVPNVEFVYVKATEGATYVDPMFRLNIKGAKSRKLPGIPKNVDIDVFRKDKSINDIMLKK